MRPSGIPAIGDMAWGTHFCHFYEGRQDLAETLVPYFKAGIDGGESCLWVTAEPLEARAAREALAAVVPDLAARERRGQIEIIDHTALYRGTVSGDGGAQSTLDHWIRKQHEALGRGYAGLRLTGNIYWLDAATWRAFDAYEARVSDSLRDQRVIALCSYCAGRCGARGVLDVVRNHEFALARRDGDWEVIESASVKIAKQELRRLNETLEARVEERTARLETALRVRDDFLSVASHELRTPLSSLKLYLAGVSRAVGRRGISDEEALARLRKAEAQCDRLEALLGNLLELTRARTGRLSILREPLDLAALARQSSERFADELGRLGRTLHVDAPEPVMGSWDRIRLDQVITNLLSNAIKYAPDSPVALSVALDGDDAVLAVRDRGPGIAAEDHDRIFDRFEQVRPGPSGFGLGLWIVKRIVEAHGGTITLDSAPGRGTTFLVRLPRRDAEACS